MENLFPLIAGSVSMLTALSAVWLSYKVYRRQTSLENENHFFKYKIDEYQMIVYEATTLVEMYYEAVYDMEEEIAEKFPNKDKLDKIADAVDDRTAEFRLVLQKHAAFIPEEIIKALDSFFEKLSGEFDELEGEQYTQQNLDTALKHLTEYEDDLEKITNMMREDIGIDAINRRLKARTHPETKIKKSEKKKGK